VKRAVLLTTVMTALLLASVAFAGGSSLLNGYGGAEGVESQVVGAKAPVKGTLPFTGTDLLAIVVGGAGLLFVGATLRRGARRKS